MKEKFEVFFIRLRDAPIYLGMDKNRFNSEVRPTLQEIPIGERGIGFDREDLNTWARHYKARYAKPAQRALCNDSGCAACSGTSSFTSTKRITDEEFTRTLTQAFSKKRKSTKA